MRPLCNGAVLTVWHLYPRHSHIVSNCGSNSDIFPLAPIKTLGLLLTRSFTPYLQSLLPPLQPNLLGVFPFSLLTWDLDTKANNL